MTVLVLRESRRNRQDQVPNLVPTADLDASTDVEPLPDQLEGTLGVRPVHPATSREQQFVETSRDEIDGYFCQLKQLNSLPPDGVFATLSAITARLGEIRLVLVRNDSRRLTALRTKEVDPLIDECERQFRFHSRIQACRQMDWDMSGKGQV